MLTTPILLVIFNRPDTTERVFEQIKKARPQKLFITADGPRANKPGEAEKCRLAREVVLKGIDWDCEVKTLFRESNAGCKIAVTSAINWFFDQVEEGIILEDDCLPADSFFNFCSVLLEKYRDNETIFQIGGQSSVYNVQEKVRTNSTDSYYFSKYTPIWGWAAWRRSWIKYNDGLQNVSFNTIRTNLSKTEAQYWEKIFKEAKANKSEIIGEYISPWRGWDYRWAFTVLKNKGLTIVPYNNLISNIGFDENASHTKSADNIFANNPVTDIVRINHPQKIEANEKCDEYYYNYQIGAKDFKPEPLSRTIKNLFPASLKNAVKSIFFKKSYSAEMDFSKDH